MKRNLIALAVTVSLAATAAAANAATENYSDVSSSWAQSDINNMVNQKVMTGFNDGKFHPDAWVTRTEFTQMTAKTLGLAPSKADTVPSLKQVSQNTWGFDKVSNQNWISSYPSGVFRPANPVRRVETLVGLAGTLNKPLVSEEEATQILSRYSDADMVPVAVHREVATAIKYNLFEVDPASGNGVIAPLRPATRAEVAAMLNDLYENRDIAIVQNGQVIAAQPDQSATSGTSMVRTTETSETTTTTTTGETAETTEATGTTATQTNTDQQTAAHIDFMQGHGTPYRNGADTIPEFRSVNVTTTPSNMDAEVPVTLPANTTFTGTVAKSLYTAYNQVGDPVMVILDHPLYDANGRVIAPAGTRVMGIVTNVVSKFRSGDTPQIGLTFNGFITPDGQQIPISATVNNTDGILKSGELQGIVFHPNRSTAALKREISSSEGGLYGIKQGKAYVLEQPLVNQVSDKPLDPMDLSSQSDIVIGVGDRLQLRIDSVGATNNGQQPTTSQ